MTSRAALHSVQIYDHPSSVLERLRGIVSSALNIGDSVLVIATPVCRDGLSRELEMAGVNVKQCKEERRLALFDADKALATFMINRMPSQHHFHEIMGTLIDQIREHATSKNHGLTVFGEMVTVLWERGDRKAALELESLWNDVLKNRAFHLHCAYPRSAFLKDDGDHGLAEVCRAHSEVVHS